MSIEKRVKSQVKKVLDMAFPNLREVSITEFRNKPNQNFKGKPINLFEEWWKISGLPRGHKEAAYSGFLVCKYLWEE